MGKVDNMQDQMWGERLKFYEKNEKEVPEMKNTNRNEECLQ